MLIKKVQKNQLITADMINNIIDSIRECQIQSGVGYAFSRNAGGTTLTIRQATGQVSQQQQCPFDVSVQVSGASLNISINAGLVNGILPSNIFSSITKSASGKKYVVINCETDGKNVITASWSVENTPPVPSASSADTAPTTFGVLVAAISGSEVYKTIPCQNVLARITPSIQEDANVYVAGKRNFTQYYNWIF